MLLTDTLQKQFSTLANFAADGTIGTAAATVDVFPVIHIPQTTAGVTLTIPNPTITNTDYHLCIANTGSVSIIVGNALILPGSHADYHWTGSSWTTDKHYALIAPISLAAAFTLDKFTHHNRIIEVNVAAQVNITVPGALPVGFQCSITQVGAGALLFVANGGMVLRNRWNGVRTGGQWAKAGLEVRAVNSAVLSGDLIV